MRAPERLAMKWQRLSQSIAYLSRRQRGGGFIKSCMITMVKNICPEKQQQFSKVCLARNTVAFRIQEVSSEIMRQFVFTVAKRLTFFTGLRQNTDASDTDHLLIFLSF